MNSAPLHLVLGATGQVGFELVRELSAVGRVVGLSRPEFDLERPETVRDAIRMHRPAVIWNAAAATAVDALEADPRLAQRINATAPGVIAEEANRVRAFLVHFSTDYVFDGSKSGPYVETDRPNPLNEYGRSKLAGERTIAETGAPHLILRTSWVYSARGRSFVSAILKRAREVDKLPVVSDQVGAPTWSRELARVCASIAPRLEGTESGMLHVSAAGSCSWYDFAVLLRMHATGRGFEWRAELEAVTASAYGAQAVRPRNSVLSNVALLARFGQALPDWRASQKEFWDTEFRAKAAT